MQLFQERDKGRLSHGGQPSLSSHLPLITSFHRLEGERKKTHTHRRGRRKAKLSPAPKNFQHFAGFLRLAGASSLEQNKSPADGNPREPRLPREGQGCAQGGTGMCPKPRGILRRFLMATSHLGWDAERDLGGQGRRARWMAHGDHGDGGTAGPAAPRQTGVPVREGEPWHGQGAVPTARSPRRGWGTPGWMGSPWQGEGPTAGVRSPRQGWGGPAAIGSPGGVRGAPGPGRRRWMGGRRGR